MVVVVVPVFALGAVLLERVAVRRYPVDQIGDVHCHRRLQCQVHWDEPVLGVVLVGALHDDFQHVLLRTPLQHAPNMTGPVVELPLAVGHVPPSFLLLQLFALFGRVTRWQMSQIARVDVVLGVDFTTS